jgi:Xaa-Pro aminopeptidase
VFIYEGYMVDCTRVFATGRVDEKLRRAHAVSGDCHALFLDLVASSTPVADIFESVWRYVSERGLDDVFMGGVRFIGHGVGLEIDEFPVLTGRWKGGIEPGMTIAFEPKFVFPEGTVGYENTYCIEDGCAVSLDRGEESIVVT